MISCIRLVPYRQFQDGTQGAILVVDWQTNNPSVYLFNSLERKKESPNTAKNNLLQEEEEMFKRYTEATQKSPVNMIATAKENYLQYGVASLAGLLISSHVADMISENLNKHDPKTRRNVNRTQHLINNAREEHNTQKLESEISSHIDSTSTWQRSILEQILPLLSPGYDHNKWMETTLTYLRAKVYHTIEEKGIRAVYESGICKNKADWGAVFKILAERKFVAAKSYLAGSKIINQVCEEEVTTDSAIKQSPALVIIGGTLAKGWNDIVHNRQSANLILHYKEIAEKFINI